MSRVFNFCAGPAVLPEDVLREAQTHLFDYKGSGMSIMEMSHRGKEYDAVHAEAIANLKQLLALDDDHQVLLLQGGASGQFAMVPMNLLGPGLTADYVVGGAWGEKAAQEAARIGQVNIAADTAKDIPTHLPDPRTWKLTDGAAYVHITSNETISGAQYHTLPRTQAPLVCDMSSDILSRPIDANAFGLIYAGAQKNLGPAGLAVVIIRKDLIERKSPPGLPKFFRYSTHAEQNSLYNTPPCFAIYILSLTTRWMIAQGGVEGIARRNRAQSGKIYAAIDGSGGFYRGTAAPEYRSDMNITFRLPSEALEAQFCKEATARGMTQLKGHRSVGGIRASIYNAFPDAGVDALVEFMSDFQRQNS
ncbi:MAG: 3-phosphoserine/phosphohydroxythreonine transaminase [Kiritimatiellae bacterium]|nr:3-phosphoserine/phosphohydroxythreonine transaminase [Kiritimatiellia bacterium]